MARELTERTASILDSASTWQGVARVRRQRGTTLRVAGRAFGRVEADTVEARFPGTLPRTVVRHGLADAELGDGWTELVATDEDAVYDATALLRLSYLAHIARARRSRPDAFPDVDLSAALDELELLPGVIHLVREQART